MHDATSAALPELVEWARRFGPVVEKATERIEKDRRVPEELIRELAGAGFFRMLVPRSLGGGEVDPETMIRAVETIARADGSTGWVVAIGATTGLVSAYLEEEAAREIYGRDPSGVAGGVFAPRGEAVAVEGGYRVTGRWPFASGCEHCSWLMGGCVVRRDGKTDLLPTGLADPRMMIFPAADARILDTWDASGLRGTGSHDIEVRDVFVPAEKSVSIVSGRPVRGGPLYAFPVFGLLAAAIAAVSLGIAASAVAELRRLAVDKVPTGSRKRLGERTAVQGHFAEAEAMLGAARSFLLETTRGVRGVASTQGEIGLTERARLRLAATHATRSAARVVDLMYEAGGGTSVYASNPLQRHFRDVHVATQHIMVAPPTWTLAGAVLLGHDADTSLL